MEQQEEAERGATEDLISIILADDWSVSLHIAPLPVIILIVIAALGWLGLRWYYGWKLSDFEIDSAELGLGDHKVSFRPNDTDRQIAYSIWVELSTRKIGLPIDPEDDVIAEIYDSWYAFFAVTRELIKDIPVSKVRGNSTSKIIDLSVEVLNEGLRPHLTKWQARFRHWYERQMDSKSDAEPQELQKQFPAYAELVEDILAVNKRLISYRKKMNELVRG
ncbi:MAG: hypothetical protein VR71_23700 [Roseovarius sp. BRH_c41]|uniref:hypothetical protein n=1 Tax=Roseovarius sp. BRH_c41 TaxID=1629709 RepID=UPI0005F139A2|nr:hypothetical protein [Roseovarius sp. BRH_c41]KJS40314.1 MAG: hypothetical protein VR71_23700 [Roseovarius sp. BRH_c41]